MISPRGNPPLQDPCHPSPYQSTTDPGQQEGLEHEQQCGFRPDKGCLDAIYTVKIALKKRREHGKESWVIFLNLVKAFDRVLRELLWAIMEKFGVPPKLVCLLKALHSNFELKFTSKFSILKRNFIIL